MSNCPGQVEIIRKAQQGDKGCQNQLAEAARVRLHEYIYRMTLREDLADDISQETVLEMFRVFHKLKHAERFWNWACGIAYNKLRDHRRRRSHTSLSACGDQFSDTGKDAVARMISDELKDIVLTSMDNLEPRHRDVLIMRCYQQMGYADIAETMGISELGARSLFCRAKKALSKSLARYGLGKSYLLAALVLFGKLTAQTPASAATVSVTNATLQAGSLATITTALTAGTAVVTALGVAAVAAGVAGLNIAHSPKIAPPASSNAGQTIVSPSVVSQTGRQQRWYFYPQGPGGPVMMKLVNIEDKGATCRYLQNQFASYHRHGRSVAMENHWFYNPDLSVMRLPTDSPAVSQFISSMEGNPTDIELCTSTGRGLLVICERDQTSSDRIWRIDRHTNVLEELFFQYDWPQSTQIVDNRDDIHKQGWAAFTASGTVAGRRIRIAGQIPFICSVFGSHHPQLQVSIDGTVRFVDTETGAIEYDTEANSTTRFTPISLFKGLSRPWTGLHTVDTVRRDAAGLQIPFETQHIDDDTAQVILTHDRCRLTYIIGLETDTIEAVVFEKISGRQWKKAGELVFSYTQQLGAGPEFPMFSGRGGSGSVRRDVGRIWLTDLVGE